MKSVRLPQYETVYVPLMRIRLSWYLVEEVWRDIARRAEAAQNSE